MNLTDTQKLIKKRIALGLNHGIKSMEEVLHDDSVLQNEFVNYKSQYNDLKNLMTQNLMAYEQIELGLNKIRLGLLRLTDQLSESDLMEKVSVPSLRNTEMQYRKNNFFKLLEIHFENLEAINFKLASSYSDTRTIDLKEGRDAVNFIYREVFRYEFLQPSFDTKFADDIVKFSDHFFFKRYTSFEVYMKTLKLILNYIMEEEMEQDFYLKTLESVLSSAELHAIFYYSLSGRDPELTEILIESKLITDKIQKELCDENHWNLWLQAASKKS